MSKIIKVIHKKPAEALQLEKGNAKEVAAFAKEVADVSARAGGGWVKLSAPGWGHTLHVGDWVVIASGILFTYSDSEFNELFRKSRAN